MRSAAAIAASGLLAGWGTSGSSLRPFDRKPCTKYIVVTGRPSSSEHGRCRRRSAGHLFTWQRVGRGLIEGADGMAVVTPLIDLEERPYEPRTWALFDDVLDSLGGSLKASILVSRGFRIAAAQVEIGG